MPSKLRKLLRPPSRRAHSDSEVMERESSIQFGSVEIREYNRVLGSHVDISNGLAIGWEYEQRQAVPVDAYGQEHHNEGQSSGSTAAFLERLLTGKSKGKHGKTTKCKGSGNNSIDMEPSTPAERRNILNGFGYSWAELFEAEKERLQVLRCQTPRRRLGPPTTNLQERCR